MNKYDKKILEVAPNDVIIHELICRPVRSSLFQAIDLLLDNLFFISDGLKAKGTYYLLSDDKKVTLAHIERDLQVNYKDVTTAIQQTQNRRTFIFEDHRYKTIRKIQ